MGKDLSIARARGSIYSQLRDSTYGSGLGNRVKGSDHEHLRAQFVMIRVGMKMEEQRN